MPLQCRSVHFSCAPRVAARGGGVASPHGHGVDTQVAHRHSGSVSSQRALWAAQGALGWVTEPHWCMLLSLLHTVKFGMQLRVRAVAACFNSLRAATSHGLGGSLLLSPHGQMSPVGQSGACGAQGGSILRS